MIGAIVDAPMWIDQVDGLVYACPDMSQVSAGVKVKVQQTLCPDQIESRYSGPNNKNFER